MAVVKVQSQSNISHIRSNQVKFEGKLSCKKVFSLSINRHPSVISHDRIKFCSFPRYMQEKNEERQQETLGQLCHRVNHWAIPVEELRYPPSTTRCRSQLKTQPQPWRGSSKCSSGRLSHSNLVRLSGMAEEVAMTDATSGGGVGRRRRRTGW